MFFTLFLFYLVLGFVELFEQRIPKKYLCVAALLPAFCLTAFRDVSVGCDTYTYLRTFTSVGFVDDFMQLVDISRMELGYLFANYSFTHLGLSFYYMQFVVSLFFYFVLFLFLVKYSKNIGVSCLIFLLMRYIFGPMNVVRMYIAIAFLLLSIPFIQKRKFPQFLLLVALACLFHKTSLLFIVLYPLSKINLSKRMVAIFLLVAAIVGFVGKSFFETLTAYLGLYESYLDGGFFNVEGKFAMYIALAMDSLLALFLLYNRLRFDKEFCNRIMIDSKQLTANTEISIEKISIVAIIIVLALDLVGLGNAIMSRLTGYFVFGWILLIPLAIMRMKNKIAAVIFLIVLSVLLLAQFEVVMIFRPNWYCIEPYSFFWGDTF